MSADIDFLQACGLWDLEPQDTASKLSRAGLKEAVPRAYSAEFWRTLFIQARVMPGFDLSHLSQADKIRLCREAENPEQLAWVARRMRLEIVTAEQYAKRQEPPADA